MASTGDHTARSSIRTGGKEVRLAKESPYFTRARIVADERKVPLSEGFFEIPIPTPLLETNPPRIELSWVDFYR